MAVISRFCNTQTEAEILADSAVAGASDVAKSTNRGYPANVSSIGITNLREFSNMFSLSAVTNGPAARAATSVGTSDTVKMFVIPANHVLLAARLEIITPASGTGLGTVALSDGTNVLAAATVATSASGTQASSVTPRFYATNTTVSVTVATAAVASGTYRVVVLAVDMTGQETTTLITS